MSWDPYSDWERRRPININNTTGDQLTNYQILIELTTLNFDYTKCEIDGSDIRFSGTSDNALDYWIEDWNYNGDSRIWVEVDSVPTGENVCGYIYYGNAAAGSESNGDNTFIFFDAFQARDPEHLTIYEESGTEIVIDRVTDHQLEFTNIRRDETKYCYKAIPSQQDFALDYKLKIINQQDVNVGPAWLGLASSIGDLKTVQNGLYAKLLKNNLAVIHMTAGSQSYSGVATSIDYNTFYYLTFTRKGTAVKNNAYTDQERTNHLTGSPRSYTDSTPVAFDYLYAFSGYDIAHPYNWVTGAVTDIKLRNFTDPEPTLQLQDEEFNNTVTIGGAGSFSVTAPFIESVNFGGAGIFSVSGPMVVDVLGAGLFDISIILNTKNEVEYTSKGNVSIESHTECKNEIEYNSKGNVSANFHLEYSLNTELTGDGMLLGPLLISFTDINKFKVTNWTVTKSYSDCMWKLDAPVSGLDLPGPYNMFKVLVKDWEDVEHCVFIGMVPDTERSLIAARNKSKIIGWDFAFYLSNQKIPKTMWTPDIDTNPANLVTELLGGSNWETITGIEPYRITTVPNWSTIKKQFKWKSGTTKWTAIQDMLNHCKYVFAVKWKQDGTGSWREIAYFVPEKMADLDTNLENPIMAVITKGV